jgi:PhnB protein
VSIRPIERPLQQSTRKETSMAVKPIPDGYHSVTPYLIVDDAARALEFYKKALGAVELVRMPAPGGRIGHAEIRIGDSIVMLADEAPQMNARSARSFGGSPISLMVYVEDVDAVVAQAVAAGGTLKRPIANQFYGDRTGGVDDPFGYHWYIATHVEDVPVDELKRRAEKAMSGAAS